MFLWWKLYILVVNILKGTVVKHKEIYWTDPYNKNLRSFVQDGSIRWYWYRRCVEGFGSKWSKWAIEIIITPQRKKSEIFNDVKSLQEFCIVSLLGLKRLNLKSVKGRRICNWDKSGDFSLESWNVFFFLLCKL